MSLADDNLAAGKIFLEANAQEEGVITLPSGLQYKVFEEGQGRKPGATDVVQVHYKGTTIEGQEFDSSYRRGAPTTFSLDQVIPGWTEGIQLMAEGSKFKFFIPPNLAYGPLGAGPITSNSTLIFEVELLKVGGEA